MLFSFCYHRCNPLAPCLKILTNFSEIGNEYKKQSVKKLFKSYRIYTFAQIFVSKYNLLYQNQIKKQCNACILLAIFFLHFLLMNNMFMDHLSCTKPSRPLKNPLKSHFASVFC